MTADPISSGPVTCAVVRIGEVWRVIHSGRQWGRFDHQDNAIEAALRLARKAAAAGRRMEVLVQARWGEISPLGLT